MYSLLLPFPLHWRSFLRLRLSIKCGPLPGSSRPGNTEGFGRISLYHSSPHPHQNILVLGFIPLGRPSHGPGQNSVESTSCYWYKNSVPPATTYGGAHSSVQPILTAPPHSPLQLTPCFFSLDICILTEDFQILQISTCWSGFKSSL